MPKFSIVIPSYNHRAFIGDAIQSVLSQSEGNLELIVVDDGSTDDSLEVITDYSDERLKVFPQTNRGAHAAINRGLEESSGEYLAILNSDDVYHPERLKMSQEYLEVNPQIGLMGSYIEIIDGDNKVLGIKHGYKDFEPWPIQNPGKSFRAGSDLQAALLTENYFATTSNFVFRRRIYEKVGDFRALRYAHDWDFALRIASVTGLGLLPEALIRYRIHENNTIRENLEAMIFEICWCLAVHIPRHFAKVQFYPGFTPGKRIEQLLNSVYTYDCDQVLIGMLIHGLSEDTSTAEELLEPDNEQRKKYLEYIKWKINLKQDELMKLDIQSETRNIGRMGFTKIAKTRRILRRFISIFR